jgi:transposase
MGPLEEPRSGLGRRAIAPRRIVALLLYASLIGVHTMTRLAAMLVTDAAMRLLTGGAHISASTLRTFRRENGDLFGSILNQSIRIALNEGFIDPQQLAIDGMRLRACAST